MEKVIKVSRVNPHAACESDVCQKYSQIERQRKENKVIGMQTRSDKTQSANIINCSYDKGGGNEISFPDSIGTLVRWNITSGKSFETAKIFSLLPVMYYLCLLGYGQLLMV